MQTDSQNNLLRSVNLASGLVMTLAGGATSGRADGAGTAASFNSPFSVSMDAAGSFVIIVRMRGRENATCEFVVCMGARLQVADTTQHKTRKK